MASAIVHGGLIAIGAWLLTASMASRPAHESSVEVALEDAVPGGAPRGEAGEQRSAPAAVRAPADSVPPPPGGAREPRPDVGRPGRGGSRRAEHASNLSSSVDPLTLERETPNHLSASEVQRARAGSERRTADDRRATPHPMELDFVAVGVGRSRARFSSASDSAPGTARGAQFVADGGELGARALAEPGALTAPGAARAGGVAALAAGLPGMRASSASAGVAARTMRPSVEEARAAVPASDRGRTEDTLDSAQRVPLRVPALLQASTLGGDAGGERGGENAPALPAAGGGLGDGSRSSADGALGPGDAADDPGTDAYFRGVTQRLEDALRDTFPKRAALEGLGGFVVIELVIREEGRVASVRLVRPSGIDEFDRNVLEAARRIPSFGPLPRRLGRGTTAVRFTWDSPNPAVGRNGAGPGRRRQ